MSATPTIKVKKDKKKKRRRETAPITTLEPPPTKKIKLDSSLKKPPMQNGTESTPESNKKTPEKPKLSASKLKEIAEKNELAKWSNLDVGPMTTKAIEKLGFEKMMEIQYKAIHFVLVQ